MNNGSRGTVAVQLSQHFVYKESNAEIYINESLKCHGIKKMPAHVLWTGYSTACVKLNLKVGVRSILKSKFIVVTKYSPYYGSYIAHTYSISSHLQQCSFDFLVWFPVGLSQLLVPWLYLTDALNVCPSNRGSIIGLHPSLRESTWQDQLPDLRKYPNRSSMGEYGSLQHQVFTFT